MLYMKLGIFSILLWHPISIWGQEGAISPFLDNVSTGPENPNTMITSDGQLNISPGSVVSNSEPNAGDSKPAANDIGIIPLDPYVIHLKGSGLRRPRRRSYPNSVVVITGAANGIGLATANLFLSLDAKVAAFDVAPPGPEVEHENRIDIICDVSSEESVNAAVKKALDTWSTIDILVNAAGVMDTFGTNVIITTLSHMPH
ncbi:hypothetical protein H072_7810 [Dactylellina haptotyla CBS 200.50]|uniref:Uncharacterized protein n=1 Tax=Dactylellina haptotyla (strain CBS 200.50) TaxID=1284197 RepID=S8A6J4_DACHA|nr:hypothetical protein H072_7810 [Dactylellina haptotyla CBS 200.50]